MQPQVPRCLGCGYDLTGLSAGRCPECSQGFDPGDAATFTRRPPFLFWKFWLPGLGLAIVSGLVLMVIATGMGSVGAGAYVGIPFAMGCIIGYRSRVRVWLLAFLVIAAVLGLVLSLLALNLAGLLCGVMLAGVLFAPMSGGLVAGLLLRLALKSSRFSQAAYLPSWLFLLIPVGWCAIDLALPHEHTTVVVRTDAVIVGPPERVWEALMLYEEVDHEPPPLLRLVLPRPVRCEGDLGGIGDQRVCVYTAGNLTKEVTRTEPGSLLEFDVVLQEFEPSVRLVSGSFRFERVGGDATRVTLTTTYEPKLGPRALWQPGERLTVQTLHRHVLEGMRRRVEPEAG